MALFAQGQQAPPVFRSGAQVVEVDARVFDRDGRFVSDLTRADFEIVEDGVPQTVQNVILVAGPGVATPTLPTSPPSTETTAPTLPHVPTTTHTWIFFFDLNHLSAGGGFDRAKKAVEEFVAKKLGPADLAGVVAGDRMVNNRLTSVREEMIAAVKSVKPLTEKRARTLDLREWPRFRDEEEVLSIDRIDVLKRVVQRAIAECDGCLGPVPIDDQIRQKAARLATEIRVSTETSLNALNSLAAGLAKMTGPKTVLLLSDGFTISGVEASLRNVVGQMSRSGARVYAIDVRGLSRDMGGDVQQAFGGAAESAPPSFDNGVDSINSISVDTGGMLIRNDNNIGRALETVAAHANTYYVVAYQPANTTFDGKYRSIEIKVKRPGVRVRARRGYLALEPSKLLVPQRVKGPGDSPSQLGAPQMPQSFLGTAASLSAPPAPPRTPESIVDRVKPHVGSARATAAGAAALQHAWQTYERGDLEQARRLLEPIAATGAPPAWALHALGFTYVDAREPRKAIAAWERARLLPDGYVDIHLDLAATYTQLSEISEALNALRAAEKRWPGDGEVQNGIGVLMIRRGALDDAIEAFKRAASLDPSDALSHLNLARAYEMRYARNRRYIPEQKAWMVPVADMERAMERYAHVVKLGGPYAQAAAEAISRLEWAKKSK